MPVQETETATVSAETSTAYELLGVSPDCSDEELKAAYVKKVQEWHPDKLQSMAQELKDVATHRLAQINGAYERLKGERQTGKKLRVRAVSAPDAAHRVNRKSSVDFFEKQRAVSTDTNSQAGEFAPPKNATDADEPPITVGLVVSIGALALLLCIIDFALHESGEIEGTFSSWLPYIGFLSATLFFLLYFWRKATCRPKSFLDVVLSVIGWHIKLAITFVIGFVLAVIAIMSILGEAGAYSESMRAYGKGPELETFRSPEGRIWHQIATFLAPFALLICIFSSAVQNFYFEHTTASNLTLLCLYLLWLGFTVWSIVRKAYPDAEFRKCALWSLAAVGTWAVIVFVAGWGVRSYLGHIGLL
jgi:hypothetical protein